MGDPMNKANRWGQRNQRRPYSIPHPNFLLHIDINMKLRPGGCASMVVLVDFLGAIIFLWVNNNNRLQLFSHVFSQPWLSGGIRLE